MKKPKLWVFGVSILLAVSLCTSCATWQAAKTQVWPPVKAILIEATPVLGTALLEDVKNGLNYLLGLIGVPIIFVERQVKSVTGSPSPSQ